MVTIKDVAKIAGVSYSTVSNVLNHKGNVASKTSRLVEEAARQLGYSSNKRAQSLRQSTPTTFVLIVPDLQSQQYLDCYQSFSYYAERNGFQISLITTNDLPHVELKHIQQLRPNEVAGIAVCTCLSDPLEAYAEWIDCTLFIDRNPGGLCHSISFDTEKAGTDLAKTIAANKHRKLLCVGDHSPFSIQDAMWESLSKELHNKSINCQFVKTSLATCNTDIFQWLEKGYASDAILCTSTLYAQAIFNSLSSFFPTLPVTIYALSSLRTMPEISSIHRYELNYGRLGHDAAKFLIQLAHGESLPMQSNKIPNTGIRSYHIPKANKALRLNILTMDSPTANILKNISRVYSASTGIDINIAIYSYEGYQEMLSDPSMASSFDIIRTDMHRLSWYADTIFTPLLEIDPTIEEILPSFIPGLQPQYTHVNGVFYTLPSTPSVELLFYRKDLFENTTLCRQFFEENGIPMELPTTFEQFNRLARFFTRKYNRYSPLEHGTCLTLGTSSLTAKEYLARYFSHSKTLYDANGNPLLTSSHGLKALDELLELRSCVPQRFYSSRKEAADEFAQGKAAMAIMFSNYAGNAILTNSQLSDRIGYAMVPGNNPLLGGGVIGVCRYSKQKEEALKLIRWLANNIISGTMTMLGSVSPCQQVYENYTIINQYPWLEITPRCFDISQTLHTPASYPRPFDELKFLKNLGTAVNSAYSDILSPKEALSRAEQSLIEQLR